MTIVAEQTFAPPRPGSWFLDPTHWTRPVTRFQAEIFPEAFKRGFGESLRRYGSLLEYLEAGFVERVPVLLARPVGAPKEAVGHPPKEVWDELAAEPSRDPAAAGDERDRVRAEAVARGPRALGPRGEAGGDPRAPRAARGRSRTRSTRPSSSRTSTAAARTRSTARTSTTSSTCRRCFRSATSSCTRSEWTGRSADELLGLLRGANPDPLGADDELEHLVVALRLDRRGARAAPTPAEPAEVVAALRSLPGETGRARCRIRRPCRLPAGERRGRRRALRARASRTDRGAIRSAARAPSQSERRPTTSRAGRARCATTCRASSALPSTSCWRRRGRCTACATSAGPTPTSGRSGSCGARSWRPARGWRPPGRIADPTHLVEADYAEIRALVESGDGPSAEELAERARYRLQARYADAPPFLGGEPGRRCRPSGFRPRPRGWSGRSARPSRRSSSRRSRRRRSARCAASASARASTRAPHA